MFLESVSVRIVQTRLLESNMTLDGQDKSSKRTIEEKLKITFTQK